MTVAHDAGDALQHRIGLIGHLLEAAIAAEHCQPAFAGHQGERRAVPNGGDRADRQAVIGGVVPHLPATQHAELTGDAAYPQRAVRRGEQDRTGLVQQAGNRPPAMTIPALRATGIGTRPGRVLGIDGKRADRSGAHVLRQGQGVRAACVQAQQAVVAEQPAVGAGGHLQHASGRAALQGLDAGARQGQLTLVAQDRQQHRCAWRGDGCEDRHRRGMAGQQCRQRQQGAMPEAVEPQIGACPEIAFVVFQQRAGSGGGQTLQRAIAFEYRRRRCGLGDTEHPACDVVAAPQGAVAHETDAMGEQAGKLQPVACHGR